MHPDAPYFIILLCLMPARWLYTHGGENAATHFVISENIQYKNLYINANWKLTPYTLVEIFSQMAGLFFSRQSIGLGNTNSS